MAFDKLCCLADTLRRVNMIPVNGIPIGLTMLHEIIAEVKEINLTSERQIKETLLKKVKDYNNISKGVEEMLRKSDNCRVQQILKIDGFVSHLQFHALTGCSLL